MHACMHTAQENWSCNIFDVIVVTAGYAKAQQEKGWVNGGGTVRTGLETATLTRKSTSSTPLGLQVNMVSGSKKNR